MENNRLTVFDISIDLFSIPFGDGNVEQVITGYFVNHGLRDVARGGRKLTTGNTIYLCHSSSFQDSIHFDMNPEYYRFATCTVFSEAHCE